MTGEVEASAGKSALYRMLDLSILATVAGATVTHAFDVGQRATIAGITLMGILLLLQHFGRRRGNRVADNLNKAMNILVISGFGLMDGFWNHLVKTALFSLHNGRMPPLFAGLFIAPIPGSAICETAGIMTFLASMAAAYAIYRIMQRQDTSP